MDPLSALSIAAAVVQFADFATRMCKTVSGMLDSQSPGGLQQMSFGTAAADLIEFQKMFANRKKFAGSPADCLHDNDQAMDKIVDACITVAAQLIDALNAMQPLQRSLGDNTRHSTTSSISQAAVSLMRGLKAAWAAVDLEALMNQLDKLQNQLVLRMLHHLSVITGQGNAQQVGQYDSLQRNQSKIVEVLALSEQKLDQVARQTHDLQRHLKANEYRSTVRDEKIVAAILTLGNGETQFLGTNALDDPTQGNRHGSVVTLKASESMDRSETSIRDFSMIQEKVLDFLYFRQQMDRYETVDTAHYDTYEWVVSGSAPEDAEWSPLVDWLEKGEGCYWVCGKAGSGKSTLMKHVFHNKRILTALESWAGNGQLGVAGFFFWNLGTELQKSQAGLLRSLLHDILSERPYLMSVVMPDLLRTSSALEDYSILEPPSDAELRRWFRALVGHATLTFRLAFFIDGVDEYEGDYRDLTDLIKTASVNKNVKFLVSSRPIPVCVEAFGDCPLLHLQQLTQNDIRCYTENQLAERLRREHPTECEKLVEEIVSKSSGVFLWVVLVCRSLQEGIQNFDTIDELRERLDELPSDLRDLYQHMLNQIPHGYRRQASEYFQLVLLANEMQADLMRLSPIQLHFAAQDDQACLDCPMAVSLNEQDLVAKRAEIEGRIRSRTMGLLETNKIRRRRRKTPQDIVCVEFFHKTAVEFLRLPSVWNELRARIGTNFNPAGGLFRSALHMCKTQSPEEILKFEENVAWLMMQCAFRYASLAEDSPGPIPREYYCELDKAMDAHWFAGKEFYRGQLRAPHFRDWRSAYLRADLGKPLMRGYSGFDSVAAFWGIHSYFAGVSGPGNPSASPYTPAQATSLLQLLVISFLDSDPHDEEQAPLQLRRAKICSALLANGADPNQPVNNSGDISPWHELLLHAIECSQNTKQFIRSEFATTFSKLLASFVIYGADVNATISIRRNTLAVLDVMAKLYPTSASQTSRICGKDPFSNLLQDEGLSETDAATIAEFRDYLVGLVVAKGGRKYGQPALVDIGEDLSSVTLSAASTSDENLRQNENRRKRFSLKPAAMLRRVSGLFGESRT